MTGRGLEVSFDERKIDAIFASVNQCRLPGAAVGISIGGRPVYRKGFGLANMELPQVLTPATRMRIASMTKPFACLAWLRLCEQGEARLDDPIGRYVPEVHPAMHAITVRQLMGHLGGNRDAHDICYQFSGTGRPVSSQQLLDLYRDAIGLNAAPDAAFCYNNGGYLLLSAAIEQLAGQPLEQALRELIFDPVGMHDTLLRRFDTDFVANSASLHMTTGSGAYEKSFMGTAYAGEGGMVSTVDDMLRWLAYMERSGRDFWEKMRLPQRLASGATTGYGLGLVTDCYRGVETISHAGGLMGGNSHMVKVPAAGLDVVVMVNRHDVVGMLLVNQIMDACLQGLPPVREWGRGDPLTGTFQSRETGRVLELFMRGSQQFAALDAFEIPLGLDEQGVLRPTGLFANPHQTLRRVAVGGAMHWSEFGTTDEFAPLTAAECDESTLITGCFDSLETRTRTSIGRGSAGVRWQTTGAFGSASYELICLGSRVWRARTHSAMPWGGVLTFDRNYRGFGFSNYRTRGLAFRRAV